MNSLKRDDYFKVYAIKIRPDGTTDIAVRAFSSAREGDAFNYLFYDTNRKMFVLAEATAPQLTYDVKAKVYKTAIGKRPYQINNRLELIDQ